MVLKSLKYKIDAEKNFFIEEIMKEQLRLQPEIKNRYSAKLNKKYRLEMTIRWINDKCTIGIIGLEDISNHYGGR